MNGAAFGQSEAHNAACTAPDRRFLAALAYRHTCKTLHEGPAQVAHILQGSRTQEC